ncbi:hypothetical protein, partial [Sinorhizobium medicae]|uniref:hypothetical protein n=1 Tax=Sinorhizobium medicae TaxID=110321 RepID=UPI001AEDB7D2
MPRSLARHGREDQVAPRVSFAPLAGRRWQAGRLRGERARPTEGHRSFAFSETSGKQVGLRPFFAC